MTSIIARGPSSALGLKTSVKECLYLALQCRVVPDHNRFFQTITSTMSLNAKNSVAVITGGSNGIGLAIAEEMIKAG